MEQVILKAKHIDVLKITAKSSTGPFVVGMLLALFNSENKLDIIIAGLIAYIFVTTFISFLLSNTPPATLTKNGILYKDWRGKDGILSPWENQIKIDTSISKSTGMLVISDIVKKKTIRVFQTVFLYPEVREFINSHCPDGHELKEFITSDS